MIYKVEEKEYIAPLFSGWQESMIWSCLQGCMGEAYADCRISPDAAQILIGDFCFLAGTPGQELAEHKPKHWKKDFVIMTAKEKEWGGLIEQSYAGRVTKRQRYAIRKEPHAFDSGKLNQILEKLPNGYDLRMIDEALFYQIQGSDWAADLCSNFQNYEEYWKHGLGVAMIKNGELLSGASSYTWYREGIEIEVDTKETVRRKGLALLCSAKLILECMKRGLYPSWDAHNLGSVALAEKLGYHFDREYTAYEITGY